MADPDDKLQEAVEQLKKLVDLTRVANTTTQARHTLVSFDKADDQRITRDSSSTVPVADGRHHATDRRELNPAAGIGTWAKNASRRSFRGSRLFSGFKTGRQVGVGVGKSLGLEAAGIARLGAAGGPVGAAVAGLTMLASGVKKGYEAMDQFTNRALETARRLSEVSGSMAAVTAEREIHEMQRDMQRGEATAGSAYDLMASESRRKEQENRLNILVDNASNAVLEVLNDIAANVLKPLLDIIESIAEKIRVTGKPVPPSGWGAELPDMLSQATAADRAGADLMARARAAAAASGGGFSSPAGAAMPGRLP